MLRKKQQPKRKPKAKSKEITREELVHQTGLVEEDISKTKSNDLVEFVSSWEDLPDGEWLPNDEDGVNWYQDKEGRYWHSTDDGFKIWKE